MPGVHEKWAAQAHYDLDTAKAMLDSGRYLYVLFCCQQAIEKMLKAIIAKKTGEFPPRWHNLERLAECASLDLSADQGRFCRRMSSFYIQMRYPEELQSIGSTVTPAFAAESYTTTEEMVQWLSSKL